MESQLTLLVGPCLSLTEKQSTINHMIILMIQSVSFTSGALEAFAEAYVCFLVSASAKKIAVPIQLFGILKKICLQG